MYYCSMYSFETKIRVRYGETDQMSFVYYGVYAQYYEVGRVELLRSLGVTYKQLEDMGFALPVVNMNINSCNYYLTCGLHLVHVVMGLEYAY